ncbi:MAG: hypothetical protein WA192_15085 [Candidatus Acidiferrales bacterium]
MAIFESSEEHPPDKIRRYIVTAIVFVALIVGFAWYLLRFHSEIRTARHFLDTVVSGNFEQAYHLWSPSPSYAYKDFLDDWGADGYYGPVKSYHIESAEEVKRGPEPPSGTVITVELSPYAPFPSSHDELKQNKTKEVRLQVEYKDQAIGFAP